MIIDELLKEIKADENLEKLKIICDKMQSEEVYTEDFFNLSEILYYHKYDENTFFEKVLTLSFDMLAENIYHIDEWQINKALKDGDEKKFKKIQTYSLHTIFAKNVLMKYAQILKKAINNGK